MMRFRLGTWVGIASGGCINCAQLLAGNAGSGIQCTNTPTIISNLLNCACTPQTCD